MITIKTYTFDFKEDETEKINNKEDLIDYLNNKFKKARMTLSYPSHDYGGKYYSSSDEVLKLELKDAVYETIYDDITIIETVGVEYIDYKLTTSFTLCDIPFVSLYPITGIKMILFLNEYGIKLLEKILYFGNYHKNIDKYKDNLLVESTFIDSDNTVVHRIYEYTAKGGCIDIVNHPTLGELRLTSPVHKFQYDDISNNGYHVKYFSNSKWISTIILKEDNIITETIYIKKVNY